MSELELKSYLKYYNLEDYLFGEVNKNFKKRGYLTSEEFFAIVFWKRKESGIKIASKWDKESIENITGNLKSANGENGLNILLGKKGGIWGVGIAIASAILTVCYPEEFTVIDFRVRNSLEKLKIKVEGNPEENPNDYLKYVDVCKVEAKERGLTLRNFDRSLWAMDWYKGEKGLIEILDTYQKNLSKVI